MKEAKARHAAGAGGARGEFDLSRLNALDGARRRMSDQNQFTVHINEARIAIDAALALADLVAQHEIVQSQSFNQLVIFLNDAAEAISRVADGDTVKREAVLQPVAHGAGRALGLVANDS